MVKRYNHNYILYNKYNLDEIQRWVIQNKLPEEIIYHEKDYKDSLRRIKILNHLMIRDGSKCIHCGKEPTLYAMGKDLSNRWHMDLYSEEVDGLLMFTIDHIHPKSKGGEDNLENYQMLCKICNEDKGDDIVNTPKEKKKKKSYKATYITNKLDSLSQQINGILTKIKSHDIVCVKKLKGFTVGQSYKIFTIKTNVDTVFNTTYSIFLENDNGDIVETSFDFFITINDYKLNK